LVESESEMSEGAMLTDEQIDAMFDATFTGGHPHHTFARAIESAVREKGGESEPKTEAEKLLPHAYLFAKVAMVMPLFEEARDALTAIREDQRIRHGIRKDLADRMDIAGTYSLDDWLAASPSVAGMPAPSEPRYSLSQIADACMYAEVPDSKYESITIALADMAASSPAPSGTSTPSEGA
jgi:hypothetical protein